MGSISFMPNDPQGAHLQHHQDPLGAQLPHSLFSGFDMQQPLQGSISFPGYQDNNVAGLSLPPGNNEILTSDVRLSRYIQQQQNQRRYDDANASLAPQLGMQQAFSDFNLGADFQDFESFTNTDPLASTGNGAINLGFEVDTSLSTLATAPSVSAYPQNQTSNATFDDPSLYLQQPSQHNFNGLSYSSDAFAPAAGSYTGGQFVQGTANMAQLQSQGTNPTQNQAGGAPQSQPNSRPGSLYGYQQFTHLQGQ
jgi:hypothetical protein